MKDNLAPHYLTIRTRHDGWVPVASGWASADRIPIKFDSWFAAMEYVGNHPDDNYQVHPFYPEYAATERQVVASKIADEEAALARSKALHRANLSLLRAELDAIPGDTIVPRTQREHKPHVRYDNGR